MDYRIPHIDSEFSLHMRPSVHILINKDLVSQKKIQDSEQRTLNNNYDYNYDSFFFNIP